MKSNIKKAIIRSTLTLFIIYLFVFSYIKASEAEKMTYQAKEYYDLLANEKELAEHLQNELDLCESR